MAARSVPGYIGSGVGFVVDKHSRTVLERRHCDVTELAGVLEAEVSTTDPD